MKPKRIPTIRTRLILLVMACLIPASLMMAALISYSYRQDWARLVDESIATARAMMSAVDRGLAGTLAALRMLATSPYLASNDLAAFHGQAQEALKTQDASAIVLVDRPSQQLVNTLRPFGTKLPLESNSRPQQVFKTGRPVTTNVFFGPNARRPIIAVGVPVRRGDHDVVTGLANRALFNEFLGHQLAICDRTGTNLALVYIDLDGFKRVNDLHGHACGDEVLRTVATRIVRAIRQSDLAARLGGDEFAVILNHAGPETAQAVAGKLIEILSMPYVTDSLTLELSASIGIAGYPESGSTSEALSQRADEAMYKAKVAGEGCYAVAGEGERTV